MTSTQTASNTLRASERAAYEQLVTGSSARAWRAARRVAADDSSASDAVQEAFLRVLDGRVTMERLLVGDDHGEGLCALSVRIALDRRRSDSRRKARENRSTTMNLKAEPLSATHGAVTSEIETHEERALVRRAVSSLSDDLRTAVRLRFEDGLSFAAIGRALDISESTAHERVSRATTALRRMLAAAGLAVCVDVASGAPLEQLLQGAQASPPRELVQRLLSMRPGSAAATSGVSGMALAGALSVFIGMGALGALVWSKSGRAEAAPTESAPAATVRIASAGDAPNEPALTPLEEDAVRAAEAAPVAPSNEGQAAELFTLTGHVVDDGGAGVPHATVRASTVERHGKFALWEGACTSDSTGSYELSVPFDDHLRGRESVPLKIEAGHLGYVLTSDLTVEARAGAHLAKEILVTLPAEERAGAYVLDLIVRDSRGEPAAGALVELTHVAPRDRARVGPGTPFHAWTASSEWLHLVEGKGRTDAGGRVRIEGTRLGAKSLWVEPSGDFAPLRTSLAINVEGPAARDIVVADGLRLHGSLRWVDGTPLTADALKGLGVTAVLEVNRWRAAKVDADGTFEVRGLGQGPLEVRVGPQWNWPVGAGARPSSGVLQLAPGEIAHALELKRYDDPGSAGVHDAELHGRAVDSVSGEVVELAPSDIFVWPLWDWPLRDLPEGDLETDVLPNVTHASPVQRAMLAGSPPPTAAFHQGAHPPGAYMLRVTTNDKRLGILGPLILGEREVRSGLDVHLALPGSVEVTVLDAAGAPVAGAWVFLTGVGPVSDATVADIDQRYAEADGKGSFTGNAGRRTDANGRASLTRLPQGLRGVIAAVHPRWSSARTGSIEIESGAARSVTVRLSSDR